MKLSFKNRIKLCWEIISARSGHAHAAQEKQLSTFIKGYDAGRHDQQLEYNHQINSDGKECPYCHGYNQHRPECAKD